MRKHIDLLLNAQGHDDVEFAWRTLSTEPWDSLEKIREAVRTVLHRALNGEVHYPDNGICSNVAWALGHSHGVHTVLECLHALWPEALCEGAEHIGYPIEGSALLYDIGDKWAGERYDRRIALMQFDIDVLDLILDEGWPSYAEVHAEAMRARPVPTTES